MGIASRIGNSVDVHIQIYKMMLRGEILVLSPTTYCEVLKSSLSKSKHSLRVNFEQSDLISGRHSARASNNI